MKKSVRIVSSEHANQVSALRSAGYSNAKGFCAHPAALVWNPSDESFLNLGAFHGEDLVSVMRIEWTFDARGLAEKLQYKMPMRKEDFPAMVLCRASTKPNIQGGGLNALLRYWSLKLAQHWRMKFVLGTMVEGSPRIGSMIDMGYEFTKNEGNWEGYFLSQGDSLVASLNLSKNRGKAFKHIEKMLGKTLKEYKPVFKLADIDEPEMPRGLEPMRIAR